MQVILLERVEKLGNLGDEVTVKPGFARNFLLPQGKALRATKENQAHFEAERAGIEKVNEERKKSAQAIADKINDKTIVIIRSASESGYLYGSVGTRDIANKLSEVYGEKITRNNVVLENPVKTIGYFDFKISLHAEVVANIKINVAQSDEEAKLQEERVARGESAVVTAAKEDAKIAAEIAIQQAEEMAKIAKEVNAEAMAEEETATKEAE